MSGIKYPPLMTPVISDHRFARLASYAIESFMADDLLTCIDDALIDSLKIGEDASLGRDSRSGNIDTDFRTWFSRGIISDKKVPGRRQSKRKKEGCKIEFA